jgi:hypothetical protein
MNTTKKVILIIFTTLFVINLQFNTPITKGMNNGFSLKQLADNIFVPEAFATVVDSALVPCPIEGYVCWFRLYPSVGCFPGEDYGCVGVMY